MKFKYFSFFAIICLCAIFCTSCDNPPVADIVVGCDPSELIDAINTANNSPTTTTTIHLSPGCIYEFTEIETYDNTTNPAGVALPAVKSPIIIDGQSAVIKRNISSGTPEFRLFYINGHGDLNLNMLTLENGNVSSNSGLGGAILNYGNLTITSSDIVGNKAEEGGAIFSNGTFETSDSDYHANYANSVGGAIENKKSMIVTGSHIFSNHSGQYGGAIANYGTDAQITDCEFNSNTIPITEIPTSMGGAIYNSSFGLTGDDTSNLSISSSTFSNNQAYLGGAIANRPDSELHIHDSILASNLAYNGGAICNESYIGLTNSTLSNNQAENHGGAIYTVAPLDTYGMQIRNCTISGNEILEGKTIPGAGIATYGRLEISYTTITENIGGVGLFIGPDFASINNSIVANNPFGDCGYFSDKSKLHTLAQANLDSDGSCHGFTLWADPMLDPLANNGGGTLTHKPQTGSPVIDAATNTAVTEDQIHQSRPFGSANDLGAYEVQAELIIVPTLVAEPQITPEDVEEPAQKPEFGWDWLFEGFVCSDMGLTEFYMKTSASAEEFNLMINEKKVSCYQQTYDTERYWCHVEKQPLGWEVPAEVTFCVGEECTTIDRTTLSENRCTSPDAPSQPVTDTCSTFIDQRDCIAAPDCSWNCSRTALGESCSCEGN